jgi:hypothetical protein
MSSAYVFIVEYIFHKWTKLRVTLLLANQFGLATSPLRLTTTVFFFQINTCFRSPYVKSSLTRAWVCRLQLLLAPTRTVILRYEPRGTHEHILFQTSPTSRARSLYLHPPGTRWPSYTLSSIVECLSLGVPTWSLISQSTGALAAAWQRLLSRCLPHNRYLATGLHAKILI